MRGPLSGKAMEYLDEDEVDLMMDLRSQYGEHGMLPLLRKIVRAEGGKDFDTGGLTLQWPRLFQPTMQEISQLIPSLVQAINPLGAVSKPGPEGAGPPPKPDPAYMLLTVEEASRYLRQLLDIDMLDEEMDEPADNHSDPNEPRRSPVPPPADPGGDGTPDSAPTDEPSPIAPMAQAFGMAMGGNVNLDV